MTLWIASELSFIFGMLVFIAGTLVEIRHELRKMNKEKP
jgi:hypothetical protein